MTRAKQLDNDLIWHACSQLRKKAHQRVREGMGPASAAWAAIRETKVLFPHDWKLAVQGDDRDEYVEVWEVEHKWQGPCAQVDRDPAPEVVRGAPKKKGSKLSAHAVVKPGRFWIAPASDPNDRYAAGYDGNEFDSRKEAKAAIRELRQLGDEWDVEWVVNEDKDENEDEDKEEWYWADSPPWEDDD